MLKLLRPRRGEVWLAELGPTKVREQSGTGPVLILSQDIFNAGPSGLVMMAPLTTVAWDLPLHVEITPPEGGLKRESYVMCENLRSITRERISRRLGSVSFHTMMEVENRLRVLLQL